MSMSQFFVEKRLMDRPSTQAEDIARHLQVRHTLGKTIIVSDKPSAMLATLRKHWLAIVRDVQRERSKTLDAKLIQELNQLAADMQKLIFITLPSELSLTADVYVVTPQECLTLPDKCRTLYVCTPVPKKVLSKLQSGVVVDYGDFVQLPLESQF